jgi:hypothetical protein
MPLYRPTLRQTGVLAVIGMASVGYASYLRYGVVENVSTGLACDAGEQSFRCLSRAVAVAFDQNGVFGYIAASAALLTAIRPQLATFAIALCATGFGLVLHNAGLAGLAAALLIMALARPAPMPEWPPTPPAPRSTTPPASSPTSRG